MKSKKSDRGDKTPQNERRRDAGINSKSDRQRGSKSPRVATSTRVKSSDKNKPSTDEARQRFEIIRENRAIKTRITAWTQKQAKLAERKDRIQKLNAQKVQQEQLLFKILNCFKHKQEKQNEQSVADLDEIERKESEKLLKKLLGQRNEEQEKIHRARQLWSIIRRKKKVIRMMGKMGEAQVMLMNEQSKSHQLEGEEDEESNALQISKFIISPGNYWNLVWNNLTQIIFVVWIIYTPIMVSQRIVLKQADQQMLLAFDIIFMLDRFLDLFVGYYNPNGKLEHRLYAVVMTNMSFKFFLEILIGFGPIAVSNFVELKSYWYSCFKIPRYSRLFEMDAQITDILEYYGQSRTVFEIKQMERVLDIAKFTLSTFINLHILTCTQVMLCKGREKIGFEDSWMGGRDVDEYAFKEQYIIAIYFVTTTLSTCGFGDISATRGDPVESSAILLLQFVGMLFYSMTIQKVQSFMETDQISPGEYANYMVEVVENLIVKVGRQLPADRKIQGDVIKEWRIYTLKYFQGSPNGFLRENEFYKEISENMKVKIVRGNLLLKFQEKFEILFLDPEFGFKADDKLISMVCASLQYEHADTNSSLIRLGVVSTGIYFLYEGQTHVYSKDCTHPLLYFDEGSYIGDISFIFQIRNHYRYMVSQGSGKLKIYSLQDMYLDEIFEAYPEFKNVLKVRAIRRHHYIRKLKKQQQQFIALRNNKNYARNPKQFTEDILQIKKVRLVEDRVPYEDLAVLDNFSADETTFALNRQHIKEKKDKNALIKAKILRQQLDDLKKFSIEGMKAIVDTISSIDENSKKILFKHFDNQSVNVLAKNAPIILANVSKIAVEAQNQIVPKEIDSLKYQSDSSGNHSEHDEINKLLKLKNRLNKEEDVELSHVISSQGLNKVPKKNFYEDDIDDFQEMSDEKSSIMDQPSEHLKKKKNLSKKSDNDQKNKQPKIRIDINQPEDLRRVNTGQHSKPAEESKKDSLDNQLEVGNSIQNVNINLLNILPSDTEAQQKKLKPKRQKSQKSEMLTTGQNSMKTNKKKRQVSSRKLTSNQKEYVEDNKN